MEVGEKSSYLVSSYEAGKRAIDCAGELGVSRQRVHQLNLQYGIKYEKYRKRRLRFKLLRKGRKRCQWCNKPFVIKQDGAKVKFCSEECLIKWRKSWSRVWHRGYYQSPRGKAYKKQYWRKQYQERNKSVTKTCLVCKKKFHPRILLPWMKYCSKECYFSRGKSA